MLLLIGCSGTSELKESLRTIVGQNISIIKTYPINTTTSFSGNKVYTYSPVNSSDIRSGNIIPCEIFFEVDSNNIILLGSYKGSACNSFYNNSLNPHH